MALTLFVVAIVTIILTGITLRTLLYQSTRRELVEQSQSIAEFIVKQVSTANELRNPILVRRYVKGVDEFTEADIYIIGPNGKLIYQTSESLKLAQLKELQRVNPLFAQGKIFSSMKLEDNEGNSLGKVILVQDDKKIERIITTTRKAIWMAILGSSILGLAIAYLLQRSITKPLKKLTASIISQREELAKNIAKGPKRDTRQLTTSDEIEMLKEEYEALMNEKLERDEELKDFFQNSSHELKTPLMSIQGYAEAIRDGVMAGDEVDEALEVIINKSGQLKRTVEGILYLSKLEHAKITYDKENVAIVKVIEEWFSHMQESFSGNGIELQFEKVNTSESDLAFIDPIEVVKVLEILLDNALRYAKSLVKLTIREDRKAAEWYIILQDDGIGIKEDEKEKIFQRFYIGENGKSGLGLAIAKKVIQDQGGRIVASNHESGGAVFTMIIPVG